MPEVFPSEAQPQLGCCLGSFTKIVVVSPFFCIGLRVIDVMPLYSLFLALRDVSADDGVCHLIIRGRVFARHNGTTVAFRASVLVARCWFIITLWDEVTHDFLVEITDNVVCIILFESTLLGVSC